MLKQQTKLDTIFSALADPTRRKIIEKVSKRNYTVVELSSLFDISLPAVSKHLKILDQADLLRREKNGKFIVCSYNGKPLNEALKWINKQHRFWTDGFDALEKYLDTLHSNQNDGK